LNLSVFGVKIWVDFVGTDTNGKHTDRFKRSPNLLGCLAAVESCLDGVGVCEEPSTCCCSNLAGGVT
jgi:hypothetical protein